MSLVLHSFPNLIVSSEISTFLGFFYPRKLLTTKCIIQKNNAPCKLYNDMQIHTPDMFCLSGHGPLAMKTSICQTALRMPPWMWQKARASKHWQLVMVSEFRVQGPARTFIMWWNSNYHRNLFPYYCLAWRSRKQ